MPTDRERATAALGGAGYEPDILSAVGDVLDALWASQQEKWATPGKAAKDIGKLLGATGTGVVGLLEQAGPYIGPAQYGTEPPGPTYMPFTEKSGELWGELSPAAKAASILGVPETTAGKLGLAAIPLAFTKKGAGPGMGAGVISDLYRGIVRPPGKGIRLSPIDEQGDFRPLHLGTRESAIHITEKKAYPEEFTGEYKDRVPTVTEFQLPVRGTLGTFASPLEDPGSSHVLTRENLDALRKLGVDAVIYRNTVEGPGSISLEALSDLIQRGEPQKWLTRKDLKRGLRSEIESPYQQYLPFEEITQSSKETGVRPDRFVFGEAAYDLGLIPEPTEMSTDRFWRLVKEKAANVTESPPSLGQIARESKLSAPESTTKGQVSQNLELPISMKTPAMKGEGSPAPSSSVVEPNIHKLTLSEYPKKFKYANQYPPDNYHWLSTVHAIKEGKFGPEHIMEFTDTDNVADAVTRLNLDVFKAPSTLGARFNNLQSVKSKFGVPEHFLESVGMLLTSNQIPVGHNAWAARAWVDTAFQVLASTPEEVERFSKVLGSSPYGYKWRTDALASLDKSVPLEELIEKVLKKYKLQ